jgi:hypothetical protein
MIRQARLLIEPETEVRATFGRRPVRAMPMAKPVARSGKEQRRAVRKPLMSPGVIKLPGFRLTVPCVLAEMSSSGASASVTASGSRIRQAADLPDHVILVLANERMEVDGQIVWRSGNRFGVKLRSMLRPVPRLF